MCCGTKRGIEIRCPSNCGYLSASRSHPPAVVQRQQQRDLVAFAPVLQGLSDRQSRLLLLLGSFIARHVPRDFETLRDDDIADAVATLAATLETTARGVIYEHRTRTQPAQHLADELKRIVEEIGRETEARDRGSEGSVVIGQAAVAGAVVNDAIIVLRRIEQSAREITTKRDGGHTGYRDLLGRLLNAAGTEESSVTADRSGSLIIP